MTHGMSYSAIPINDDDDVECLIDVAKECKCRIYLDLYVRTSLQTSQAATQVNTSSYPVVETQSHSPMHHNQQVEAMASTWYNVPRQDMSYQSPMHYEANEYFQYDVQHRAASEYGPNESPLEEDSNTDGDFSEYDEEDGLNSEFSDEEGAGSLGESLPEPEMSTQVMEAAANPVEARTA